jgi:hypothetical protein
MVRFEGCPRIRIKRPWLLLVTLVLIVALFKNSFPNATLDGIASFSVESYSVLRDTSINGTTSSGTPNNVSAAAAAASYASNGSISVANTPPPSEAKKPESPNASTGSASVANTKSPLGTSGSGEKQPETSTAIPVDDASVSRVPLGWTDDVYAQVKAQGSTFDSTISIRLGDDVVGHVLNGRLVANVDESYLFWFEGSLRLCDLLRNMTLSASIDGMQPVPPALVNVTMDCVDYATNRGGFGQGNWVTAVYSARMAAALAGVDFQFQCKTGRQHQMELLLPWFDRYQVAPTNRSVWPYSGPRPNQGEACPVKYPSLRIDHMASQMQDDLRKMAVTLVGSRGEARRHPEVPHDAMPLIPDVVLDDVALHFRCGDVLGGAKRNDFGMIRFNEYKKWIPHGTPSIGILTQSFEKDQNRNEDKRKADACRTVVAALADYLHSFAPSAQIFIRNSINETLPLTYARLVMANYSITSLSSFGIFPVIGTFGQGYFQKGNRGVNPFATHVPKYLENVHQMEAEVRGTGSMWGKPVEELIEWFVHDPNKKEQPAIPTGETTVATPPAQAEKPSNRTDGTQPEGKSANTTVLAWNHEVWRKAMEGADDLIGSTPILVEEAIGFFRGGKLVVNVDQKYLFWKDGARKLCRLLKNMTLAATSIVDTQPVAVASLVNITMDCLYFAKKHPALGQGNWVTAVYSAKMAAAVAGVDFKFQCKDLRDSQMKFVLPWFDQYQPALRNRTVWPYGGARPTQNETCPPSYPFLRIDHVASMIRDDLRRMAVTIVGTRDYIRRHPDVPAEALPLIPNVQLDDVALHFRCGDVLGGARRSDFGMIRFNEYKKWIPKDIRSIGILTQPFEIKNSRPQDRRRAGSCQKVVYALVDYLNAFAPRATIRIHNGVNETLPLAYARLVMANYSITSLSSFGIFPVIGTFGQGYFQKGNSGVNPFATYIPAYLDNVHEMEADCRTTASMIGQPVEDLIAWFVNDTETALMS